MITRILRRNTPAFIKKIIPFTIRERMSLERRFKKLPSYKYLESLMKNYQIQGLVNVSPKNFQMEIKKYLEIVDYKFEGYLSPDMQRDLSIKFHWGHNHDFGDFKFQGRMGNRHINLLSVFIDEFKDLPKVLRDNIKILDIGTWTGGTSLLLHAMGAKVVAIEEVKKYVECLKYLKKVFNLYRLEPQNRSLYDCTSPEFQDSFDFVLFAGVLYHVSDPIMALRITFNCLKDGGVCLLETASIDSRKSILSYKGPAKISSGKKENLNRSGWSWFFPSPTTISQMMYDVGYRDIKFKKIFGRTFAIGKRYKHVDIMRSGLSIRDIR